MALPFAGNPAVFKFAKAMGPVAPVKTAANVAEKASILERAQHNLAVERDTGANIIVRNVRLGDLWDKAKEGVALQGLADAEWVHMPPHPSSVSVEIFVNGSAGSANIDNKEIAIQRGFVLTPGGSVRIPKADFVTVRPVAHGTLAFRNPGTLYKEIDGGGALSLPGREAPSDARFFDKTQSFTMYFSRDFLAPQAPVVPVSITLPGLRDATNAAVRSAELTGANKYVCFPWDVAPLEVLRRYQYAALILTQAPTADFGGGVDLRPPKILMVSTDSNLPLWAIGYLDYLHFGCKQNANFGSGRGVKIVLPLTGNFAAYASALLSQGLNPHLGELTEGFSLISAQWLLSDSPIPFEASSRVLDSMANGEHGLIYAGPVKTGGRLQMYVTMFGTALEVKVYALPSEADLTDITTATPLVTGSITAAGPFSLDIPGGGNVAIVVTATGANVYRASFVAE